MEIFQKRRRRREVSDVVAFGRVETLGVHARMHTRTALGFAFEAVKLWMYGLAGGHNLGSF